MDQKHWTDVAIERAIRSHDTIEQLADALGVSHQSIYAWRARGQIGIKRVIAMEILTGVDRRLLRPDIYGEYTDENPNSPAAYMGGPVSQVA